MNQQFYNEVFNDAKARAVITPGAQDFLAENGLSPLTLLTRHASGDWGDLDASDKELNDAALIPDADGVHDRVFSSYNVGDDKVWVITEWDRSVTTILMSDEY